MDLVFCGREADSRRERPVTALIFSFSLKRTLLLRDRGA